MNAITQAILDYSVLEVDLIGIKDATPTLRSYPLSSLPPN
jgi:hypothetical protein